MTLNAKSVGSQTMNGGSDYGPEFFKSPAHGPTGPATPQLIETFERQRGLVLPSTYVTLLRIQNGGYPRKSLFVGTDDEYRLNAIGGIGEEQHGLRDILTRLPFQEGLGAYEAEKLVAFDGDALEFIALDYRSCEDGAVPSVVAVDTSEPPVVYHRIASDIDAFLDGLVRSDPEYYIGLCGVEDDVSAVVGAVERFVGKRANYLANSDVPTYSFRKPDWRAMEEVWLLPNIDFGPEYDAVPATVTARSLYFPEFPEIRWMVRCAISGPRFRKFFQFLDRSLGGRVVLMHEPTSQLEEAIWYCPESETIDCEPETRTAEHRIWNAGEYRVELPPNVSFVGAVELTGEDATRYTFTYVGDFLRIRIDKTQLFVGEKQFGEVMPSDQIRIVSQNEVFVNGIRRQSI